MGICGTTTPIFAEDTEEIHVNSLTNTSLQTFHNTKILVKKTYINSKVQVYQRLLTRTVLKVLHEHKVDLKSVI